MTTTRTMMMTATAKKSTQKLSYIWCFFCSLHPNLGSESKGWIRKQSGRRFGENFKRSEKKEVGRLRKRLVIKIFHVWSSRLSSISEPIRGILISYSGTFFRGISAREWWLQLASNSCYDNQVPFISNSCMLPKYYLPKKCLTSLYLYKCIQMNQIRLKHRGSK